MALIRPKLEPKRRKELVLTCWKMEPEKEEEDNSKKIKIRAKEKGKDMLEIFRS